MIAIGSIELPRRAQIITRTARLILRTWTADDVDGITRVWSDPETMRHAGVTPPDRIPRALQAGLDAQAAHGVCLWAVELPGQGVIGDCGFFARPDGLELAYHFARDVWGRGYATEAARAPIAHAVDMLGARRIVAWVSPANPASVAVLERLGFVCEGPDPAEDHELRYRLPLDDRPVPMPPRPAAADDHQSEAMAAAREAPVAPTPPRWDLKAWFDDFGPTFDAWLDGCEAALDGLDDRFAQLGGLTAGTSDDYCSALLDLEARLVELQHARVYAGARAATDSADERAAAALARLSRIAAAADGVEARIIAALGAADGKVFDALCARPALADARYHLTRWRSRAARAMSPEMEGLSSALGVDGLQAWARLYSKVTGGLSFDLAGERVPLAWLRGRLQDPDPHVRSAALAGASAALASQAQVFAAALNGIAGTRLTLDARRGLPDPLDEALFEAAIDRETLEAMMGVVADKAWIGRRFLALKAKLLGRSRLGWSDLRAPLGAAEPASWPTARDTVLHAFEAHHPALADFARTMFDNARIEAEPRDGKRPGAFCTRSFHEGSSRVYLSYTGSASDIRTLAHELGHAYHNHAMAGMRAWSREYPMTLAETASIVAETLVSDAQLADPDADRTQRLRVLDARLGQVVVYLLDIPTRLAFEQAFYAERARGEVSVERLCQLMAETQLEVFGEALDPEGTHPWFWAEKLHFFLSGRRFYNFPYTFGYLFGQGVLTRARAEGVEAFHPTYIELLRRTGSGTVEQVAGDVLGVDLRQPGFWAESLAGAEADLAAFEALVAEPAR